MTRILTFTTLVAIIASPACAQVMDKTGAGATMQGKARGIISEQYLLRGAHAARRALASETVHKLNAIVLRNPAFSPPMGLDIATRLVARTPSAGVSRGSIQYEVGQLFYWYRSVRDNKIVPETVHSTGFSLYANEISMVFSGSERWVFDPEKQIYLEPRKIGEESGFPYYSVQDCGEENGSSDLDSHHKGAGHHDPAVDRKEGAGRAPAGGWRPGA